MPLLDISSLEKSVAALERATDFLAEVRPPNPIHEHVRGNAVQCFEVSLELSLAFMRRYALARDRKMEAPRDVRDILRIAEEEGLIDNPQRWMAHRKIRNITSHTYDENKADEAAAGAAAFLTDAKEFVARLRAKVEEAE